MKTTFKSFILVMLFIFMCSLSFAQDKSQEDYKMVYIGPGIGLDYGGLIGARLEFLPSKYLGLFGCAGYNLLDIGWNVGGSFKILPDKKVTPTLTAFYGYNAVFKGIDTYAERYNKTSYGITFGGGVEFKFGKKQHKLTTSLLIPIRSKSFNDNYDAAKADPFIDIKNEILPIAISVGFLFAF